MDQFDEAVPLVREIDSYQNRKRALIEGDLPRQALPLLEERSERADGDAVTVAPYARSRFGIFLKHQPNRLMFVLL